jgi:DNA-binding MarR family transcriptional regulator
MSKYLTVRFDTTQQVHDSCLCFAAQRTARVLARHFDEKFRPLGLTNGQFSLLMALNRPEPPSIGEVAGLLAMDRTTLTAALKPLERDGHVKVTVDPADRRSRRLALTAAGHRLLAAALPVWKREHARVEKRVGSVEVLRTELRALA